MTFGLISHFFGKFSYGHATAGAGYGGEAGFCDNDRNYGRDNDADRGDYGHDNDGHGGLLGSLLGSVGGLVFNVIHHIKDALPLHGYEQGYSAHDGYGAESEAEDEAADEAAAEEPEPEDMGDDGEPVVVACDFGGEATEGSAEGYSAMSFEAADDGFIVLDGGDEAQDSGMTEEPAEEAVADAGDGEAVVEETVSEAAGDMTEEAPAEDASTEDNAAYAMDAVEVDFAEVGAEVFYETPGLFTEADMYMMEQMAA